ncbi:hypothetical protein M422DRAFT_200116 [Sphaerobolus stellatus SS14]|nr:hypothetical protein M422DRAFT_200116 [Sphaerobolus stellatus SS14]
MQLKLTEVIRLLETDYVPSHIEGESYRESLTKCKARVEEVTSKINVLEEQIKDLAKLRDELRATHEATSGLFAPIRRLPVEILSEIFLQCLPPSTTYFYYPHDMLKLQSITSTEAPLILLGVCKRWRRIALDTPRLFTELVATNPLPLNAAAVTNLWLDRSKVLPIDVSITPEYWGIPEELRREALKWLGEQSHRIWALQISPSMFLDSFIPPGSELDAPSMKEITILYSPLRGLPHKLGRLKAPNLEKIDIRTSVDWRSFLTFGTSVTSFSDNTEHAPEDVLQLLRQLPNIRSFSAETTTDIPGHTIPSTIARVSLPKLEQLSLVITGPCLRMAEVLQRLRMPRLAQFTLRCDPSHYNFLPLWTALSMSQATLERLTLNAFGIEREAFHTLLSSLPNISDLALEGMDIAAGNVFEQLQRKNGLCPKLRMLDLSGSSFHSQTVVELIDMVSSRIPKGQDLDGRADDEHYLESINLEHCNGFNQQDRHIIIKFSGEQPSVSFLHVPDAPESDDSGSEEYDYEDYEDDHDDDYLYGMFPF